MIERKRIFKLANEIYQKEFMKIGFNELSEKLNREFAEDLDELIIKETWEELKRVPITELIDCHLDIVQAKLKEEIIYTKKLNIIESELNGIQNIINYIKSFIRRLNKAIHENELPKDMTIDGFLEKISYEVVKNIISISIKTKNKNDDDIEVIKSVCKKFEEYYDKIKLLYDEMKEKYDTYPKYNFNYNRIRNHARKCSHDEAIEYLEKILQDLNNEIMNNHYLFLNEEERNYVEVLQHDYTLKINPMEDKKYRIIISRQKKEIKQFRNILLDEIERYEDLLDANNNGQKYKIYNFNIERIKRRLRKIVEYEEKTKYLRFLQKELRGVIRCFENKHANCDEKKRFVEQKLTFYQKIYSNTNVNIDKCLSKSIKEEISRLNNSLLTIEDELEYLQKQNGETNKNKQKSNGYRKENEFGEMWKNLVENYFDEDFLFTQVEPMETKKEMAYIDYISKKFRHRSIEKWLAHYRFKDMAENFAKINNSTLTTEQKIKARQNITKENFDNSTLGVLIRGNLEKFELKYLKKGEIMHESLNGLNIDFGKIQKNNNVSTTPEGLTTTIGNGNGNEENSDVDVNSAIKSNDNIGQTRDSAEDNKEPKKIHNLAKKMRHTLKQKDKSGKTNLDILLEKEQKDRFEMVCKMLKSKYSEITDAMLKKSRTALERYIREDKLLEYGPTGKKS